MDRSDRPLSAGDVVIEFGGRQWVISPGDLVTVGRSGSCEIRLPNDDHLSRRAGSLRVLDDCVLVRNESTRKPLVMRPPTGADRIVEPGTAITSLPFRQFEILLSGSGGQVLSIQVDACRLTPESYAFDPPTTTPETRAEPIVLTGSQRRVLAALCEPLLTGRGPRAAPATYAQIGQRLDLRPQYIRNVVKSLRETLTGYGVDGLAQDDQDSAPDDFRLALARWAIRNGFAEADDDERA
jgi:hypothetical protein